MKKALGVLAIAAMLLLTLVPSASAAVAEWTVIVYMGGDNNLENQVDADMSEIVASNSPANVLVLADKLGTSNTAFYHIKSGVTTPITGIVPLEINSGSNQYLKTVITYAAAHYPANHYAIVFWDHGIGWGGCCFDMTSSDYIDNYEIRTTMAHAYAALGQRVDVVGWDACYMAQMDILYEVKDYADIAVGSAMSEPWNGWDYNFLAAVGSGTTKEQFAGAVCTYYGMQYATNAHTLVAVNLTKFDTNVAENFNMLMQGMKHRAQAEAANILDALSTATPYLTQQSLQFRDLYEFADRLQTLSSNDTIDEHATRLMANITDCTVQFNGTVGHGIGFYFSEGASSYYHPYSSLYICQDTQADEAQKQFFRGADIQPSLPDRVRINATVTTTTLSGEGVQYKLGRGNWRSIPYGLPITSETVYARTWNGLDYSEQNVTTLTTNSIVLDTDYAYMSVELVNRSGYWNIFAPYVLGQTNMTASSFCNALGLTDTRVVMRTENGTYIEYRQGRGYDDFPIVRGGAYYIRVEESASFVVEGSTTSNQSIGFSAGLNLFGYYANKAISAGDLNHTSVTKISKRDGTGTYLTFWPQSGLGDDFQLNPGEAFFIHATEAGGIEI